MITLVSFLILTPLFLFIYGLITFFDLVGTGIEYLLIGGGFFLALAIIAQILHLTFSTLFGKVGEVLISIILAIPIFAVALSVVGVIAVIIITVLAFPFVFIVGVFGVSWQALFSVIAAIVTIICFLVWYQSTKNEK